MMAFAGRLLRVRPFVILACVFITAIAIVMDPGRVLPYARVVDVGPDRQLLKNTPLGAETRLIPSALPEVDDAGWLNAQWVGPFGVLPEVEPLVALPEGSSEVELIVSLGRHRVSDSAKIDVLPCFALSAEVQSGVVDLTFPPQADADRSEVYRASSDAPAEFARIADVAGATDTYRDPGRTNGQTYLYVVGTWSGGVGCFSNIVAARPTQQAGGNGSPVIYSTPSTEALVGFGFHHDVNAVDPDGGALAYSLVEAPADMTLDERLGLMTWTPQHAGVVSVTVRATDPTGGSATRSFSITVRDPSTNRRPRANAGPDQKGSGPVVLDGSGSTDPDGDLLSYAWAIVSSPAGSSVQLSDPTSVMPQLVFDRPGEYVIELTVADAELQSSDRVVVSTDMTRPIARAGRDRTRPVGRRIQVDGTASSDPEGDPLSYAWTLIRPADSRAKLSDATAVNPTFVIDTPGSYTARLVVRDGSSESEPAEVVISTSNSTPVAAVGPDQTVDVGASVGVDARRSWDRDDDPLLYRWSIIARPVGSTAQPTAEKARKTQFVADQPGLYVVQLIVSDGKVLSDPDTLVVTASPVAGPNHRPVALDDSYVLNAGRALSVPAAGVLDNDTDPDGDPLRAILVEPPGSGALILSPAGSFTYTPNAGPNRIDGFTYKVSDGRSESAPAEVTIEVSGVEVAVSAVDTSGVVTDGQTLDVSGYVRVVVENRGSRPLSNLSIPFLVFEDRNNSGVFDDGDVVLGRTIFDGAFNDGNSTNVDIAVSGETRFRDTPLLVETGGGVTHRPPRTRFSPTRGSPLPAVKFTWDDPKSSDGVWSAPVVAPLIDTDGDGKIDDRDVPAIIFVTNNNRVASQEVMRLVALRGDTGEEIFAVEDPDNEGWSAQMITPAVSDLDADGVPEILAVSWDQKILWAFSNDGMLKWQSDVPPTNQGNPYLADVDGDGLAEILYGANSGGSRVYTYDGTLKTVQTGDNALFASERDSRYSRIVADLDLDGTPEIISGPSAITKDGAFLWGWRTIGAGTQYEAQGRLDGGAVRVSVITQMPLDNLTFTAVANIDDDPYPEIIAISTNIWNPRPSVYNDSLWIFEHDGRIHAGPFPLINDDSVVSNTHFTVFGPPAVADFDGDGKVDIALGGTLRTMNTSIGDASRFLVAMYRMDGTVAWRRDLSLEAAQYYPGYDPLSAFDFDGDGAAEIVVKDAHKLYILSGRDGATLYQQGISFDDGRRAGYVTIADVDNDGHADLVVPLSRRYEAGAKPRSGIVVIGDANGNWGPARGVWNQYNYHITNVEDDGSIPRRAENAGSLRLQGIRQGIEKDWAPDLTIARIDVDAKPCTAGAASLTARVGNAGDLPARSGIKVHFYDGDPSVGGALVGEAATLGTLPPGSFEDVTLSCVAPPKVIFATVNSPLPVPPVPSDNLAQLPHTWAETSGLSGFGTGQAVSLHQNAFEGIDGTPGSRWNSGIVRNNLDPQPPFYEVHFPHPVNPSSLTLINSGPNGFLGGSLTFSNGFSTAVEFDATGQGTVTFPEQQGVRWVRLTAQTMRGGAVSVGEFVVAGSYVEPEFRVPEGAGRLANNIVACGEGIVPCGQGVNRPPAIVSAPITTALAMKPYVYDVQATDDDGDALTYSLALAPSGMTIDGAAGRITWTPPVVALGEHTVVISVEDPRGFSDDQTFSLTVSAAVTVPDVEDLPQAEAEAALVAAHLTLGSVAVGASASVPNGSVVEQSPAAGTEVAQDSPVDIVISGGRAPVADAGSDRIGDEAATVTLDGSASSDPDGQPLTYQWTQVTGTAVALIDATSARPSFVTPQVLIDGELGFQLQVSDGGLTATDDVIVLVRNTNNEAPTADAGDDVYISTPRTVTLNGSLSSDPNGQPITFAWTLLSSPAGSAAVLSDPGAQEPSFRADEGGQYLFELVVSDGDLTSTPDRVLVNMQDGRFAPTAQIRALEALTDVGSTTTVRVVAADDVGVGSVVVRVDGIEVPVDSNGFATFQTPRAGTYVARVTVTDVGGRSTEDSITVRASERGPSVDIVSPEDGAVVTGFTDIVGTAADGTIVEYTVSVAPIDGTFTEIARGTQAVQNGVLASFDPTVLPNGSYTLRLAAVDAQGNGTTVDRQIEVAGDLKLGNFRLSFEDLSIPVAGVPILIRRTYDTLEANASRDLGFGWRMDVLDVRLQTSVPKTGFEGDLIFNGFRAGFGPTGQGGTRVYITRPGGKREGFTFKPVLAEGLRGGFLRIFLPEFVPDPGVKGKLTARQTDLSVNEETGTEGQVFPYGVSSIPYNPANPQLGGSYTYMTEDGLIYSINGLTGKTTSVRDGNGNTLTVTADGVTSSTGDKVTFERDSNGRITAVIDPLDHRVRYDYDAHGDLVKVTDREGNATQYLYRGDRRHYLERIIDPLERPVARTEYDEKGRLTGLVDATGNRVAFEHLANDHTEVVQDALGNPTTYVYDDRGNVLREIDALGGVITRQYDDNNNMSMETDQEGNATTYKYDTRGNLITRILPTGTSQTPADMTTNFEYTTIRPGGFGFKSLYYDVLSGIELPSGGKLIKAYDFITGRLLSMSDENNTVLLKYEYDGTGQKTAEIDQFSTISWTYDSKKRPIRVTDPDGKSANMTFDDSLRLAKIVESDGSTTSISHDSLGREVLIDYGNNKTITYDYDTASTNWSHMEISSIGRFERNFDAAGRLVSIRVPGQPEISYIRDSNGNIIEEKEGDLTSHFQYDELGRLKRATDPSGRETLFAYDKASRLTSQTDALGKTTELTYEPDGNISTVSDPLGRLTSVLRTPRSITITDALNRKFTTYTNSAGLATRVVAPDQTDILAEYIGTSTLLDAGDQPTSFTDELRNKIIFTYNARGKLISVKDPSSGVHGYDYFDSYIRRVNFPGTEAISIMRDNSGRVVEREYSDGSGYSIIYGENSLPRVVKTLSGIERSYEYTEAGDVKKYNTAAGEQSDFTYDVVGNVARITDGSGEISFTNDSASNLTKIQRTGTGTAELDYDILGRVKRVTIAASGSSESYHASYDYDDVGNLISVVDPGGGTTTFSYDAANRLTTRELPNGIKSLFEYDVNDRIVDITHRRTDGHVLASRHYERNAVGDPERISREDGAYTEFKYDKNRRIIDEESFNASGNSVSHLSYRYDLDGNRAARSSASATHSYNYRGGFRLDAVEGRVKQVYRNDADGRMISINRGNMNMDLQYDSNNRLLSAQNNTSGLDLSYQNDGLGQRVRSINGSRERRFLMAPALGVGLSSPHIIADENGEMVVGYVYANPYGAPLLAFDATRRFYYLTDAMGSVITIVDEESRVISHFDYDGFGRSVTTTPISQAFPRAQGDFAFHGLWLEKATNLYNVRARDYDPETGRFLTRDPATLDAMHPESLHPYVFARSNPNSFTDPTGRFTITEIFTAQGIQDRLQNIRAIIIQNIKDEIVSQIKGKAADLIIEAATRTIFPSGLPQLSRLRQGQIFESQLKAGLCKVLPSSNILDYVHFEVSISVDSGDPINNGFNIGKDNCSFSGAIILPRTKRPDFIISGLAPLELRQRQIRAAYTIGDFKLSAGTVYRAYAKPGYNVEQLDAIAAFARRYTKFHSAVFVTWDDVGLADERFVQVLRLLAANRAIGMVLIAVAGQHHFN